MLRTARAALPSLRFYSTAPPPKPSLKLVAELRKQTEVSISKAREALSASNNDIIAALEWLQKDLAVSGAQKAAKVEGRTAGEGLVGISVLADGAADARGYGRGCLRAAMIELNCETDFVARNDLFGKLVADIAHTAAFISEPSGGGPPFMGDVSLDVLNDAPLLSQDALGAAAGTTVADTIRASIAKLGEKISLKRAIAVYGQGLPASEDTLGLRIASYTHGGVGAPLQGRIGSLAVLALKSPRLSSLEGDVAFASDLEKLQRSLGRQIAGFETRAIRSAEGTKDETALYDQPFMMYPGSRPDESVRAVLHRWAREKGLVEVAKEQGGLQVLEMAKWTVGENEGAPSWIR